MNKVMLMGRITKNPEIRYSQGDNSVAVVRFTLAVDRRFKRDNEATADFISCVAFGKTAEFFEKYVHQGTKLCVEGRIQTGSYTKQDGSKVYTTDVVVENVEFAESKAAAGGQAAGNYNNGQAPVQNNYAGQQQYQQAPQGGFGQQQYQQASQNGYAQQPQGYAPQYEPQYQQAPSQSAADEGFMQIPDALDDEGLPFN